MIHTIGVFALLFDKEGKILLSLRTDNGLWNLPGGRLEPGESPTEGLVREVKEETGLTVEVDKLQGVYSKAYSNDIVLSFLCSMVNGELTNSEEAKEHRYFAVDQLPDNMVKKHHKRIQDYLAAPDDVESLIQAIEHCLGEPPKWSSMGEAGYRRYLWLFQGKDSVRTLVETYYLQER